MTVAFIFSIIVPTSEVRKEQLQTLNMHVCPMRSDSPLIEVVHAPRAQDGSKSLKVWPGIFEIPEVITW